MSDDSTNATETQAEKTKRTRLSPRIKFADETVAVISVMIADLESQSEGANKTTTARLSSQVEVLNDLRGRVIGMAAEGVSKPEYSGRHFIGRLASDGSLVAFDANTLPSVRSHGPGTVHNLSACFGPQRTKEGRVWRMEHAEALAAEPVVFA